MKKRELNQQQFEILRKVSKKPNITAVFPFKEAGITKADVLTILDKSGIGLPKYYEWRTRSGCYFCFFQRKIEWVGLKQKHKDLFEKAKSYEKTDNTTGERYTWVQDESLEELSKRSHKIISEDKKRKENSNKNKTPKKNQPLFQLFDESHVDSDEMDDGCLVCHL